MLDGNDVIVEMDESLFGKRKYNRGRRRDSIWVLGPVERTQARKIKLCIVKNRIKFYQTTLLIK
ncbi:hypothetical protein GVAV_001966 [Gurleya vavrai]